MHYDNRSNTPEKLARRIAKQVRYQDRKRHRDRQRHGYYENMWRMANGVVMHVAQYKDFFNAAGERLSATYLGHKAVNTIGRKL